jgi:hypothetical protein
MATSDPEHIRDVPAEIDLTTPNTCVMHPASMEWICDNVASSSR